MPKLNCLIGDIIMGFVRVEFILSQILFDIGLKDNKLDFFADGQTEKKLKSIHEELTKTQLPNKKEFIQLIEELDELRMKRNVIVHSLVLTNMKDDNNHMFHNYLKIKGSIINKTTEFNTSDLEDIHSEIIRINNSIYELHYH